MVCDWWVTKLAIASLLVVEVNNSCALPICAELQQRDERVFLFSCIIRIGKTVYCSVFYTKVQT